MILEISTIVNLDWKDVLNVFPECINIVEQFHHFKLHLGKQILQTFFPDFKFTTAILCNIVITFPSPYRQC